MSMAPGQKEELELKDAGLTLDEIQEWRQAKSKELYDLGLTRDEVVKEYFGVAEPDMATFEAGLKANIAEAKTATKESKAPKVAGDISEAFSAGMQMSSAGLAVRGEMPDTVLSEETGRAMQLAHTAGQTVGDIPAMLVGAIGGGFVGGMTGTAVMPGPGTVAGSLIGAGAVSNALPEFIRQSLIDNYKKGAFTSFSDFWDRATNIFVNTEKSALVGGVTSAAGGVVGSKAIQYGAGPVIKTGAQAGAELFTMVTAGKAVEGEVPTADDFVNGAILVAGFTSVGVTGNKLMSHWSATGQHPESVVKTAETNPVLKQKLVTTTREAPSEAVKPPPVEKPAPKKVNPPTIEEANKAMDDFVKEKPETVKEGTFSELVKNWYQKVVDKFDPIKQLAGEEVYQTARMVNDYDGIVLNFFKKGVVNFKTKEVVGKSFEAIMEPFKDNLQDFKRLLIAERGMDLIRKGINPGEGFDAKAAKVILKNAGDTFSNAKKELGEWQAGVLQYAVDAGILSKDARDAFLRSNPTYIPFKRVLETVKGEGPEFTGKNAKKPSSFKATEGAEAGIIDPFQATLENAREIIREAEINRAKTELVDSVLRDKNQGALRKVELETEAIDPETGKVVEKKPGMEAKDAGLLFRAKQTPLDPGQFEVVRNGKRERWETTPEIAEAVSLFGGNPAMQNVVINAMGKISSVKKLGISLTPEFVLRNLIRDTYTATMYSKAFIANPLDFFSAVGNIIKADDTFYAWMRSGGGNASFLNVQDKLLKSDLFKTVDASSFETKGWPEKALNVLKKRKDLAEASAMIAEQATRLAEFKRVTKGDYSAESLKKGGFAAREITLDFQRMGSQMQALNMITAFQNVAIQDVDKLFRSVKANPGQVAARGAALITVPSLLLWQHNKDDERYKALPDWQKNLFWIIPTDNWVELDPVTQKGYIPPYMRKTVNGKEYYNNGVIYRIPKPGVLGIVFGSLPERMLDAYTGEVGKSKIGTIVGSIADTASPAVVPDAILPIVEHVFNRSLFTGGEVVPHHLEKIAGDLQYKPYTSELAKGLGKAVGSIIPGARYGDAKAVMSPVVYEHYFRSYTGTIGDYALKMIDGLMPDALTGSTVKPAWQVADMPTLKAFAVRFPSVSAQPILDFEEAQKAAMGAEATIKKLRDEGRFDEMVKELKDPLTLETKLSRVRSVKAEIDKLAKVIDVVNAHVKDPDEKRQLMDGYYYVMIEQAKLGNQIIQEISKQIKKPDSSNWSLFKRYKP